MKITFSVSLVTILAFVNLNFGYAEGPDVFKSPTMGFEVTKPDGWHYSTASEHFENLSSLSSDEQIQEHATVPTVAMMKFPEPYPDVNPSFRILVKPYGSFRGMDPKDLLETTLDELKKIFPDLTMDQSPTYVEVSGIRSGYARMTYTLERADGEVLPILSETWIVPREHYFMIIGAGIREDEKTGTREEIAAILSTLRLDQ